MKRSAPPLGFHGLTIGCPDPVRAARAWNSLLRLPVLRRSAAEVVLGGGPELFIRFRRRSGAPRVEEAHLAVEKIRAFRRPTTDDSLGGRSFARTLPGPDLVVREFERAPRGTWKKPRRR
ncbi:MAG TPA: hypothetical protein VFS34_08655 [Thermoanaerobaculia bacterium]|nr:hypothetical protein [Thermoanaerobaculia bacterium]